MIVKVYCRRCDHQVKRETSKDLRKEYSYYCPYCDENMYSFETYKKKENKHVQKQHNDRDAMLENKCSIMYVPGRRGGW